MIQNEFDDEIKYRLFRSVKEILHPTISKKNISNYKIIIEEDILPVRIFYPKKVSNLTRVMIMIHGNAKVTDCMEHYSDICKELSIRTNSLVIAIEYKEEKNSYSKMLQEIEETVNYLLERLQKNDIDKNNIILVGDSTGGHIVTYLQKELSFEKEILFYPTLSLEYWEENSYESFKANENFNFDLLRNLKEYFDFVLEKEKWSPLKEKQNSIPKTLLFVGKVDSLRDEAKAYQELYKEQVKYVELPFASHGFLRKIDTDMEEEVFQEINEFME